MNIQTFIYKNTAFRYSTEGEGYPVVLLHGFMESIEIWEAFSGELSRDFLCICPDLPGHGKSGMMAEKHSMGLMAETVKALLSHLGCIKCILVGHSMGGYVSLAFAENYPDMVAGFVLLHSSALADTEEAKENRRRTIEIVKQNHHSFIAQFIPGLFAEFNREPFRNEILTLIRRSQNMAPEGIIAAQAGMLERPGYLDLLTRVVYPILFIAGKHDTRIPVDKIMAQAMLPWHSEVLLLGNAGHMGFIEAHTQVLPAIKYFCERVWYPV